MSSSAVPTDRFRFLRLFVFVFGAMALLITVAPQAMADGAFVDDDSSAHEADIEWIAKRDITQGCNPPGNDRYCPGRYVTRGQMAAYLSRAHDMGKAPSAGFVDADSSTFEHDIDAIARAGVTRGCNPPQNNRYCPDDIVTRGQMAAFLTRAWDLKSTSTNYFYDDNGTTFETDINAVAAAGITVGCGDGEYCPNAPVTREQMASFIRRAISGGLAPPEPVPNAPSPGSSPPTNLPRPGASKPAGAVVVQLGDNLQQMVNSRPGGTTFYLTSGTHRLEGVTPKSGNEFVGAPGAIMSGARVLTSFTKDGSHWVVSGQTQQNPVHGDSATRCEAGYSGCLLPEQLFVDGKEFWQVTSRTQLKSGSWYFDYGANKIYLADNPSGRLVETSVNPHAFIGAASNVTIRDLIIEKYASPANMGAVHGRDGRGGDHAHGWEVMGNEIRFSASNGVHLGDDMEVRSNYIHNNGRLGIGATGSNGALAASNEISYNCKNTGFQCFGYGGGGVKFAHTSNTTLSSNYVHHNQGHALHDDEGTTGSVYENNLVVSNDGHGIMIEISFNAIVRKNTVRSNGFDPAQGRASGIRVQSSQNVTVTGNLVTNNAAGIVGWEANRSPFLHDLTVTNNTVLMNDGYSGLRSDGGSVSWGGRGVEWNNNTYDIAGIAKPFHLNSQKLTSPGWRGEGYDTGGDFK